MRTKAFLYLLLGGLISTTLMLGGCNPKKPMQAKKIPLEDFFKNPDKTRYQISPYGKYFSYLSPYEKRLNIFVQEIGKGEDVKAACPFGSGAIPTPVSALI